MQGSQLQEIMALNIKRIRKQRGFTQSQLAERAGISFGYMNDIERSRRWPSAENIARLADALRLDPYQLFLPNQDSPYFDRHHTLSTFSRLVKQGVSEKIDEVLESLLQPYGPLRNEPDSFSSTDEAAEPWKNLP